VNARRTTGFRSLRLRILTPIVVSALVAAVVVAVGSHYYGTRWADQELETRFRGIKANLSAATYPLTATVLGSIAELTQTELVTLDESGSIRTSTLSAGSLRQSAGFAETASETDQNMPAPANSKADRSLAVDGREFVVRRFRTRRGSSRADRVVEVLVLFDRQQLGATSRRAALLPLVTGLSTIVILSSITLSLTTRLVRRISLLQSRVEAVAAGDFEVTVADEVADEIGRLGGAVDSMAGQLSELWKSVEREQGEKLLHQIAGGMAHQLRNSLTGARMAIELHATECRADLGAEDEGLRVAVDQIETAEDYVRRLLMVASGKQDQDRPMSVGECTESIRKSLTPIAKHLNISFRCEIAEEIANANLEDGPSWIAAVTNLVQNAMQAGDKVQLQVEQGHRESVRVRVIDNGPGVPRSLRDTAFEPFVTSKPEGLGLGLAVVKRAAERLGGDVRWHREQGQTVFEVETKAAAKDPNAEQAIR
jgi:signal transduction histidine kinase